MKLVASSFNVVYRVRGSLYFAKDIGTCKKVSNIREEQSSSQAYYLRPRPTDKHSLYPLQAAKTTVYHTGCRFFVILKAPRSCWSPAYACGFGEPAICSGHV
jgi:hypothetical protein